ncbi:MAG: response regulator [Opitutaceae bacterium]|nr:response regulator [Opitutaceae bacterium]
MNPLLAPILAAEDEESDAFLLRYAFEKSGIANPLIVVGDGFHAVSYLRGDVPYDNRAQHPLPVMVLLDLKMPRMSGFDVLRWLANQPAELRDIPAYIFSSSPAETDRHMATQLGAQDYFVKPHDLGEFVAVIRSLPIARMADAKSKA